jgi:hypothetical protein
MSSSRFADNPTYVEFERLLVRLNDLMAHSQGETEEADALREQMFDLRSGLDAEEQARLEGLSADLYMLQNDEVCEDSAATGHTPEEFAKLLKRACETQDWSLVLSHLRKGPVFLSREQIASLRGSCYKHLGHTEVAQLFADYAFQLAPGNVK